MKIVIQRVRSASVRVDEHCVGEIERGLLLLVGFGKGDTPALLAPVVEKISTLRLFVDDTGKFEKSVLDIGGGVLIVSQFTLYADTNKGRRPDFFGALEPKEAQKLYDELIQTFRSKPGLTVETGQFGAYMSVSLENDGPVTIILER